MGIFHWLVQHWVDLVQSVGIIGGLVFTALSARTDSDVRRVANLLTITKHHRDIWTWFYERPDLLRVIDPNPDLEKHPITKAEELFVTLVVLHLSSAQEAIKQGMFAAPDRLQMDVRLFFSPPIPRAVWERIKPLQDSDFAAFVQSCLVPSNDSDSAGLSKS